MLVTLRHGTRAGETLDVLPESARAMVADGRAVWPEGSPFYVAPTVTTVPEVPRVTQQVAARADRGMPSHRKHRHR